ncbi:MAG: hypothetical protein KA745_00120 [Gemmatimonadales bacterium]|nr:hypothetical protein [Gemmatimonadales bacterium]
MGKKTLVTFRLSAAHAKALWGIIDGAADAGACQGGLTPVENAACQRFLDQYYKLPAEIADDTVGLSEAAGHLLRAHDADYRTASYRTDLWECLRDALTAEETDHD